MAEILYVLMGPDGPVGIVDEEHKAAADQWAKDGANDYVAFEKNNLNLTGMAVTPLTQQPESPDAPLRQQLQENQKVNERLETILQQLRKRRKSSLLKSPK